MKKVLTYLLLLVFTSSTINVALVHHVCEMDGDEWDWLVSPDIMGDCCQKPAQQRDPEPASCCSEPASENEAAPCPTKTQVTTPTHDCCSLTTHETNTADLPILATPNFQLAAATIAFDFVPPVTPLLNVPNFFDTPPHSFDHAFNLPLLI